MAAKCILILLNGAGNPSHRRLGRQTPLQAAATPVLDHRASLPLNRRYAAALPINGMPTQRAGRFKSAPPFEEQDELRGVLTASGILKAPHAKDPLMKKRRIAARLKKWREGT